MRSFVKKDRMDPRVRNLSLSLIKNLPQKDDDGQIRALYDYVKFSIRYVRDINGVETIQDAINTLRLAAGDCDDKATLLAAMLESIGYRTRFHAMGFRPGDICHVIVEVWVHGDWLPLETTEPVDMGWIPPDIIESIYNEDGRTYRGLGFSLKKSLKRITKPITKVAKQAVAVPVKSTQAILKPVGKVLETKAGQTLLKVASAVPSPITPFAQAATVATSYDMARRAKVKASRDTRDFNNQVKAGMVKADGTPLYVMDKDTGQYRDATATDQNVEHFYLDTKTNTMISNTPSLTSKIMDPENRKMLVGGGILVLVLGSIFVMNKPRR